MRVTGGDFYVVGGVTAIVIGAAAMLLLFRLVDRAVGRWEAVVAVVFHSANRILRSDVVVQGGGEECLLIAARSLNEAHCQVYDGPAEF